MVGISYIFFYPALTAVVESMRFLCWRCLVEAGIYQEREVGPEESKACEEYEEEGRVSHSEPVFLAVKECVDELTKHLQQADEQAASDETKSQNWWYANKSCPHDVQGVDDDGQVVDENEVLGDDVIQDVNVSSENLTGT